MKKNTGLFSALALSLLVGLSLSGCGPLESGMGTIKLTNNSTNVIVGYWALERLGETIWDEHREISPRHSVSHDMDSAGSIWVYVEESGGDGWLSKTSYTVRKDETVEVIFPKDFSPARSLSLQLRQQYRPEE